MILLVSIDIEICSIQQSLCLWRLLVHLSGLSNGWCDSVTMRGSPTHVTGKMGCVQYTLLQERESHCDISHSSACKLTSNIKEVLVFLLLLLLTAWRCLVMRAFHIPFPPVCGFYCHFQNHELALTALLKTCEFLAVTVQWWKLKHGFNDETWFILHVLSLNRSGLWALSIDFALHNYLNSKKDEATAYLNTESF